MLHKSIATTGGTNWGKAIHDFCKKELAPYAAQIDRDNGWDQLR